MSGGSRRSGGPRWIRLRLVVVVVGVVMVGVPVLNAEGATGDSCLDGSTGSLSTSNPELPWHDNFTLTWQFRLACPPTNYGLQLIGPHGVHQNVDVGTGQSNWLRAWTTGVWWLQLQNRVTGGTGVLASVNVTVNVPGPLTTGETSVDITDDDVIQSRKFVSAIQTPGVTVRIAGDVDLDLSGLESIEVAPGVSIIGDRSVNPKGPRLVTQTYPKMLFMIGDGHTPADRVRISGIRLEGAEGDDPFSGGVDTDDSDAIVVNSSNNVEIDHNELFHWRGAAVHVRDQQDPGRITQDNAATVWVHDNFIHHNNLPTTDTCCTGHGAGYGVELSYGGYALVEWNVFDNNRHSITGDGREGTGYLFYRNLILPHGGVNSSIFGVTTHTHVIDMHGRDCAAYQCGPAGEFMDIDFNTILYTNDYAIKLRGTPLQHMLVHRNVFAHGNIADAVHQNTTGLVLDENVTGFNADSNTILRCDFDGGGSDPFMATGNTWWYFSNRRERWIFFNQSPATLPSIAFADLNGDGYCDATANGQTTYGGDPGISPIAVPSLTGLNEIAALAAITAAGLTVGQITEESGSPAGIILAQSPPPGALRSPGQPVAITVTALGIPVPNVLGLTETDAINTLDAAGLPRHSITRTKDCSNYGKIVNQFPLGATVTAPGTTVFLTRDTGTIKTCEN